MNIETFWLILSVMAAMAVILSLVNWGIPWLAKRVSSFVKARESNTASPVKSINAKIWLTITAIFIVLCGIVGALTMAIVKFVISIGRFFVGRYDPNPPVDKPIKPWP